MPGYRTPAAQALALAESPTPEARAVLADWLAERDLAPRTRRSLPVDPEDAAAALWKSLSPRGCAELAIAFASRVVPLLVDADQVLYGCPFGVLAQAKRAIRGEGEMPDRAAHDFEREVEELEAWCVTHDQHHGAAIIGQVVVSALRAANAASGGLPPDAASTFLWCTADKAREAVWLESCGCEYETVVAVEAEAQLRLTIVALLAPGPAAAARRSAARRDQRPSVAPHLLADADRQLLAERYVPSPVSPRGGRPGA